MLELVSVECEPMQHGLPVHLDCLVLLPLCLAQFSIFMELP